MTEREAIVAWLRKAVKKNDNEGEHLAAVIFRHAAKAIKSGQHLENKDG